MASEDADYVCTLDQATIKKAKAELNENPQDRLGAVQAFREWIQAQPHIKCPSTDTFTMLKFLRGAKFSQIRAREMIEGNLLLRTKLPDAYVDVDTHDPKMLALAETGYMIPLPTRTKEGCTVLIFRLGKLSDCKWEIKTMMKMGTVFAEYLSRTEMTQVNGTVFLEDYSGVSAKLATKMMNKELGKWQKEWQKNIPGRFKAFHEYNIGVLFETLMAFFKPFMPKKWLERIYIHETMESVYKHVPMECLPLEYLPDDYTGPSAGSCDELVKKFIADIKEESFRQGLLNYTSTKYGVDLSKKPEEQVTEHFRKLNVD